MSPLPIVAVEAGKAKPRKRPSNVETMARLNRMWHQSPPKENKKRLEIAAEMIEDISFNSGVDIGCGHGTLARQFNLLAVDGSSIPLKPLPGPTQQSVLPFLTLPDFTYDLVVCTDVLDQLPPIHYRLAVSDLSRICKRDGHVVISVPLDRRTDQPLEHFYALVGTEFEILDVHVESRWLKPAHVTLLGKKKPGMTPDKRLNP